MDKKVEIIFGSNINSYKVHASEREREREHVIIETKILISMLYVYI